MKHDLWMLMLAVTIGIAACNEPIDYKKPLNDEIPEIVLPENTLNLTSREFVLLSDEAKYFQKLFGKIEFSAMECISKKVEPDPRDYSACLIHVLIPQEELEHNGKGLDENVILSAGQFSKISTEGLNFSRQMSEAIEKLAEQTGSFYNSSTPEAAPSTLSAKCTRLPEGEKYRCQIEITDQPK